MDPGSCKSCVRYREEREHLTRLPTLVVLVKVFRSLSVEVNVCTFLDRPCDVLRFVENLSRLGAIAILNFK